MEATLIASNLSKHVTYVASTADYLRGQLDNDPSILEQSNVSCLLRLSTLTPVQFDASICGRL